MRAFNYDAASCSVNLVLDVVRENGQVTEAELRFAQRSPRFVQQVTIDGRAFGFDVRITGEGESQSLGERGRAQSQSHVYSSEFAVYQRAYRGMWRQFAALAHRKEGRTFDSCVEVMKSYTQTF